MKKHLWLERGLDLVLLLALVICVSQVFNQKIFIMPLKFFSVQLFLEERMDFNEMKREIRKTIIDHLKNGPNKERFKIINPNFIIEKKQLSNDIPVIAFVSDCEKLDDEDCIGKSGNFVNVVYNNNAVISLAEAFKSFEVGYYTRSFWLYRIIEKSKKFSPDDFFSLQKQFPRVVYSYEEIKFMQRAGVVLLLVKALSGKTFDHHFFGMRSDNEAIDIPLLAYAQYFQKEKNLAYWLLYAKCQGSALGIILLGGILVVRIFNPKLGYVIERSIRQRMNSWQDDSEKERRLIYLLERAEEIRNEFEGTFGRKLPDKFKHLYEVAIGGEPGAGKSIFSREASLVRLEKLIDRARAAPEASHPLIPGISISGKKADSRKLKDVSKKQILLAELKSLGVESSEGLDRWNSSQLKKFITQVRNKKADAGQVSEEDNFNELRQSLPDRVVIVHGKLKGRKKERITNILISLGAKKKEIDFVEASVRRVAAIAKRCANDGTLVILLNAPHGNTQAIQKNKSISQISIQDDSLGSFKRRVLEEYRKI
jgi:hypothetical protein